jgi:hypothetical protein
MTRFLLLVVGVVAVAAAPGYTIAGLGGLRDGITFAALRGAFGSLFAALIKSREGATSAARSPSGVPCRI